MKKSFAFVFSMVMVIGLMAMSVLAQPITDIHTHIDTFYQGSSLVDKGTVTFSNSGTTTMKVALKGFGGQNRGWHTNTVSGTGTRSAVSGNVDHEYQNTSVVYSVY